MSSVQNDWVVKIIVIALAVAVILLILFLFKDMIIESAASRVDFIKKVFTFDK